MCDQVAKFLPQLVEAVKILRGVTEEVAVINEELESIEYFINHADRMAAAAGKYNEDDDGLKRMVKDLSEATLRIEEVTEDYMSIQPPTNLGCSATTDFIKTIIPRLRISYKIKDIKSSIVRIKERFDLQIKSPHEQGSCFRQINERSCFGSRNVPPQHALPMNSLYVDEANDVGFEAPRGKVIGWLKEKREERIVIVVVGMRGQGKTTLAKTVYDNKVIGDFDCHAWITVSQTYTVQGLLRAMLDKFNERSEEVSKMGLDSLVKEVRKYLQQKRYVFFFDDVWNEDFWTEIEPLVLDNKNESRIVITTRNMKVAKLCKESSFVYILNLQPLSSQQSRELFLKKAFRNEPGGECPTWLEDISSNLLKNCKGLPLAIVSISNLLTLDKSSPKLQFLCKSLIFERDWNQCSFRISNIFCLNYDDLPLYLKPCLLYFGIYPKNYKVKHKRLIRHWISEGFVKFKSHKTLEDDAEQYLKELMDRSLVQVSSFSIYGKPKTYSVHFLVHDMIIKKIKDMNICHFVSYDENDLSMRSWKILSLQIEKKINDHWNLTSSIEGSLIRSLYVFQEEELPKEFVSQIPGKYKRLRIFDFENNRLKYIPQNFCTLIYLKYLSFKNTRVHTLPESIGNLQNLETLDVKLTNIKEMPREITKLTKLRHLLVDGLQIMEGVGNLKSLQTLRDVEIGNLGKELEKLKQLRVLGLILDEQNYLSVCSSINKMQNLEKLFINASEADESINLGCLSPIPALQKLHVEGHLERFPEWIPKHQNLVALTLRFSNLTDPLKPLIHLPNLLSLSLIMAYGGETLRFKNGEFQKLRKLVLKELHFLDSIDINEGALSSLEKLVLHNIPYFIHVPSGINHLGKLQVLCIDEMPREFVDRVRENDWINNHVAQVTISKGKKIGRY